ncbi:MAG: hypothetical protein ACFFCE_01650 [Promethearchaeota archaeon]
MNEIKDDNIMSEQKFFDLLFESFEFVMKRDIISNFIRKNNEFAYTIEDIYKITLDPIHQLFPFDKSIDYYPAIKSICDDLEKKKNYIELNLMERITIITLELGGKKIKSISLL